MARTTGKFPVTRQTGRHRTITGSHAIVKRTLLVVDDEPDIARLVARIFERRGYHIMVSLDGEEALQKVAAQTPDLILLDLNLPKMDGWEVCRRLKSDTKTRGIPIIILSAASVTPDDARYGFELGADEYVIKPFVREVLVHNVERLLGKKA